MVTEKKKGNRTYYFCDECGFAYLEQRTAQQCQNYCARHNACSMEITKKSVRLE